MTFLNLLVRCEPHWVLLHVVKVNDWVSILNWSLSFSNCIFLSIHWSFFLVKRSLRLFWLNSRLWSFSLRIIRLSNCKSFLKLSSPTLFTMNFWKQRHYNMSNILYHFLCLINRLLPLSHFQNSHVSLIVSYLRSLGWHSLILRELFLAWR